MTARADPSVRPGLRLFLDSAERAAWERWLGTGLFFGVTTNPTILDAAGLRCTLPVIGELVRDALAHGIEEIQVQSWGTECAALLRHGLEVAALSPRVVVKVPATLEGVRAVASLHRAGVRTTLTAVYAPHQALIAAAAGCDYVAPYFGRIGDAGRDAPAALRSMQAILQGAGRTTRLLVASLRRPEDLALLAAGGIGGFTFGARVAEAMFAVAETIAAASQFEATAAGDRP